MYIYDFLLACHDIQIIINYLNNKDIIEYQLIEDEDNQLNDIADDTENNIVDNNIADDIEEAERYKIYKLNIQSNKNIKISLVNILEDNNVLWYIDNSLEKINIKHKQIKDNKLDNETINKELTSSKNNNSKINKTEIIKEEINNKTIKQKQLNTTIKKEANDLLNENQINIFYETINSIKDIDILEKLETNSYIEEVIINYRLKQLRVNNTENNQVNNHNNGLKNKLNESLNNLENIEKTFNQRFCYTHFTSLQELNITSRHYDKYVSYYNIIKVNLENNKNFNKNFNKNLDEFINEWQNLSYQELLNKEESYARNLFKQIADNIIKEELEIYKKETLSKDDYISKLKQEFNNNSLEIKKITQEIKVSEEEYHQLKLLENNYDIDLKKLELAKTNVNNLYKEIKKLYKVKNRLDILINNKTADFHIQHNQEYKDKKIELLNDSVNMSNSFGLFKKAIKTYYYENQLELEKEKKELKNEIEINKIILNYFNKKKLVKELKFKKQNFETEKKKALFLNGSKTKEGIIYLIKNTNNESNSESNNKTNNHLILEATLEKKFEKKFIKNLEDATMLEHDFNLPDYKSWTKLDKGYKLVKKLDNCVINYIPYNKVASKQEIKKSLNYKLDLLSLSQTEQDKIRSKIEANYNKYKLNYNEIIFIEVTFNNKKYCHLVDKNMDKVFIEAFGETSYSELFKAIKENKNFKELDSVKKFGSTATNAVIRKLTKEDFNNGLKIADKSIFLEKVFVKTEDKKYIAKYNNNYTANLSYKQYSRFGDNYIQELNAFESLLGKKKPIDFSLELDNAQKTIYNLDNITIQEIYNNSSFSKKKQLLTKLPKSLSLAQRQLLVKDYFDGMNIQKYQDNQHTENIQQITPYSEQGRIIINDFKDIELALQDLQKIELFNKVEENIPSNIDLESLESTKDYQPSGLFIPRYKEYLSNKEQLYLNPKLAVIHGLTGINNQEDAIKRIKLIIENDGLKSIAQRRNHDIKVSSLSPLGDIASGIDKGVPCKIGCKPSYGKGVYFIMKPEIILRKNLWFSDQDFGGGKSRNRAYNGYAKFLGQDNIYTAPSRQSRLQHLKHLGTNDHYNSNEVYFQDQIRLEEIMAVVIKNSFDEKVDKLFDNTGIKVIRSEKIFENIVKEVNLEYYNQ